MAVDWTLFILMDYLIHTDIISMELSILCFRGCWSKLISVLDGCFNLSKQYRPWWIAAMCGISSGSSLFAKVHVHVYWYPEWLVQDLLNLFILNPPRWLIYAENFNFKFTFSLFLSQLSKTCFGSIWNCFENIKCLHQNTGGHKE